MKTQPRFASVAAIFGIFFAVFPVLVGCTAPKVDWQSRVGSYTFDQAVIDLGPPDKSSKLTDGTLVAEWIESHPSGGVTFGFGTGYSSGHSGVGVGQAVSTSSGAKFLRLTFASDGRLTGYTHYRR